MGSQKHGFHIGFVAIVVSALILFSSVGCKGESEGTKTEKGAESSAANLDLNLPAPPKLGLTPVAIRWPDGNLSVFGLFRQADEHWEKTVNVKGVIESVYQCPEDAKKCDHPHFYITDGLEAVQQRLMVVGYEDEDLPAPLASGMTVVTTGRFGKQSLRGFLRSAGLVDMREVVIVPEDEKGEKAAKGEKKE